MPARRRTKFKRNGKKQRKKQKFELKDFVGKLKFKKKKKSKENVLSGATPRNYTQHNRFRSLYGCNEYYK